MKKINNIIIAIITIISYIIALKYLKNKEYIDFLKTILILPTMLIIKIRKINLNTNIKFAYLIFIFFAYFLGVIINLYDKIIFYDTLMHFISGIFTAYLALNIIKNENKIIKILFILGFVSLIATTWEIFEYTSSIIFNVDPQKVVETGINDTMKDIIVALLGGILVVIFTNKKIEKKSLKL